MSLFKSRDWWSVKAGSTEEYDTPNICIGNVDNNPDGSERIVVGSFQGVLRIYRPGGAPDATQEDLLLEFQTDSPILDVGIGRLVGDQGNFLALLHPRKLAVCSVTSETTTEDTGTIYNVSQIYSHKLDRTSCNMVIGPFGNVKDKDFMCVQSMDGQLSFFEQDSFAFSRFIPQFLIPGPLCYVKSTDTFITSSSTNFVEAYRYQTLAVSTESQTKDQNTTGTGKRLRVDWQSNIGDNILDIQTFGNEEEETVIFVLGEHNLFALRENGVIKWMKKYEFSPCCFIPYKSMGEGIINMLVVSHTGTCYVWQDATLIWNSSFEHVPIFIGVLQKGSAKGHIVTLTDDGKLCLSYLGTDPSFQSKQIITNREINYEEKDKEMASLQQTIRKCSKPRTRTPLELENV